MISTVSMWGSEVPDCKTELIHFTRTACEVMWSYNVTTIAPEVEKCKSSVFLKERLIFPRSITLLRQVYAT